MDAGLAALVGFFREQRAQDSPLVLATVTGTHGSTYRKAGARMLIARNGVFKGLLSGGCFEADLKEHAAPLFESGEPRTVTYDLTSSADLVWGLGLGCEGAVNIFLQRIGPDEKYQPFAYMVDHLEAHEPGAVATVLQSTDETLAVGASLYASDAVQGVYAEGSLAAEIAKQCLDTQVAETSRTCNHQAAGRTAEVFYSAVYLPPRILLLGGGPDALPVVDLAAGLGWQITVVDHRPAYADLQHFPQAHEVLLLRPEELSARAPLNRFEAAVIMSHHLPSDQQYLAQLLASSIPYIGLLGPTARKQRLLEELGSSAAEDRVFGPVGLDLGAQTPESIALAIVAELHAVLFEGSGRHMNQRRSD